ncbi:MAG: NAD(P)H-quinone oxidoreductase, partial [Spongiibacteraceae bacterium]
MSPLPQSRRIAIVDGDSHQLSLGSDTMPTPGPVEVLIKVAAAGINRPDILQKYGLYPAPADASPVLGLEVAGVVVAVGSEVSRWHVGDRICALCNGGGYADYTVAPAEQCLPVPESLSLLHAAALPETLFTVWHNVFQRGKLQAGENFLVHGGSSGIGTTAIALAKAAGATVYATAGSDEKCAACIELGAAATINYKTRDFVDELKRASNDHGMDVILDMVGGDYIQKNISLAALDGRIVNVAYQGGFQAEINFLPVLMKRLSLSASTLRPQSPTQKATIARELEQQVLPDIAAAKVQPVIDSVF